jgi:S-DNA-T family DNA segregation ATPase FtsK/SpoIIIE
MDRLTVGVAPLVDGAVLVDDVGLASFAASMRRSGGHRGNSGSSGKTQLFLLVHSGPASGQVIPLHRGRYCIGRSGGDINLADPDMSRRHALLELSREAITIEDLGSSNGTRLDGLRISRTAISIDSIISCGATSFSVVFVPHRNIGLTSLDAAGSDVGTPIDVQRQEPSVKGVQMAFSVALPLLVGVGTALATGMWWFLAFSSASAFGLLLPVIAGRRSRRVFRRSMEDAAKRDAERRHRAAPSAVRVVLACSAGIPRAMAAPGAERSQPTDGGASMRGELPRAADAAVRLRIGTHPGTANIRTEPPSPGLPPQSLGMVPITFDPRSGATALLGPEASVVGLARFLIMQLAAFPQAAGMRVVLFGHADRLPLSARFLPNTVLSADADAVRTRLSDTPPSGGTFILFTSLDRQDPTDSREQAELLEASARSGWQTIICGGHPVAAVSTTIDLSPKRATLLTEAGLEPFEPDLVPADVFDRFCRSRTGFLAASEGTIAEGAVPENVVLGNLVDWGHGAIKARWAAPDGEALLAAPIGQGRHGSLVLDLERDGPHFLIAGTTGSGKSELMRTFVAALSLIHSPDRINFLFIDFKGGSGLAPLAGLPHCVGMLTDLGRESLGRFLQSLRAEVRLRERLLAAGHVPDLKAYRLFDGPAAAPLPVLPYLLLVVDEFRMLVEEAPAALAELIRIATIGRSLGIHLVMATQRPQGALSADIRANVTSSIALRVQSASDSHDILNSRCAAGISVDTPGRAFLVRGPGAPEEFQTATLHGTPSPGSPLPVRARPATAALQSPAARRGNEAGEAPISSAEDATQFVAAVSSVWTKLGGKEPRQPVAPPLPPNLAFSPVPEDETEFSIALCLADVPEKQRLEHIHWAPMTQGHLALIGEQSGTARSARTTAAALLSHPLESHLYIFDADSSFPHTDCPGRIGAVVRPDELSRAARILHRLATEASSRLHHGADQKLMPLILCITGWGSWVSSFRAGPYSWAEDLVHEIVRAGKSAGIAVIVSGGRELVSARLFPSLETHAFFPHGSTEEARFGWPRLPDAERLPGRAVLQGAAISGPACIVQFPEPAPDATWPYSQERAAMLTPFKVLPLPERLTVEETIQLLDSGPAPQRVEASQNKAPPKTGVHSSGQFLWIGVGGDNLDAVSIRLSRGGAFLALGAPASGKSALLRILRVLNPKHHWLQPGRLEDPSAYWFNVWNEREEKIRGTGAVMLIDDLDLLDSECQQYLADLNGMGHPAVFTADFHAPLYGSPLAVRARARGDGLLLAPLRVTDGDFFGIRYEVEQSPPPGRAVLFRSGRSEAVQLAIDEHAS